MTLFDCAKRLFRTSEREQLHTLCKVAAVSWDRGVKLKRSNITQISPRPKQTELVHFRASNSKGPNCLINCGAPLHQAVRWCRSAKFKMGGERSRSLGSRGLASLPTKSKKVGGKRG